MKKQRGIFILVVALVLGLALAACGSSNSSVDSSPSAQAASETETETSEAVPASETETEVSEAVPETENILIAYFSNTGNTEEVAQKISEYTGGSLADIQRAEEYGDLQEEDEAEILDGVHPEITVSVDNIAAYDTIFVGYPIWWDEAPRR